MAGKFNCCVPQCFNNWRNSPNLKFNTLPSDAKVRQQYVKLIRNDNLKVDAQHTRICGSHFPLNERMCRTQLPSIFPWTSEPPVKRRSIMKHELPVKGKKRIVELEATVESDREEEQSFHEQASVSSDTRTNTANTSTAQHFTEQPAQVSELDVNTDDNRDHKINELQSEILRLQKELLELKRTIQIDNTKPKFDIDDYKHSDEDIAFFTGFPNYEAMLFCFSLLEKKAANLSYGNKTRLSFDEDARKPGTKRKLTTWQEFTMVAMRLRLGSFERDLADRFRVSLSTVSTICRTWIRFMRKELEPICILWPSKEQIIFYMPPVVKSFYPSLVSIIDCTEIQMESPSSLDTRSLCYSSYKSRTTMKALLGITPNGVVSFCSELYCGSISDPAIVKESGFLSHLNRGDLVMADKGFTIQDELASVGVRLVMPHFLKGKKQFTKQESDHNKKIASLRIHVERYMETLKNWHFFDRPITISMSDIASDAWIVVACFSNFLPPMIN